MHFRRLPTGMHLAGCPITGKFKATCILFKRKPCHVMVLSSRWSSKNIDVGLPWKDRNYQFLQQSIVPTMHFQNSLPRLPIPKLEKTCERYLNGIRPLVSDDQFQKTQKIVKQFQRNEGRTLHQELVALDKRNKHTSYICEPWFDMYLKSRVPLVLNFNPFLAWKDDPQVEYNDQLVRATNMVVSSMRFFRALRADLLEPEVFHLNPAKSDTPFFRKFVRLLPRSISWYGAFMMNAFPLDMSQFKNLFNTTRIPKQGKDEIRCDPSARHIVVLRNGHFYVFDVLDKDGNVFPACHIHACLAHIMQDNRTPPSHPVSVLTAENRDQWAKVREHLENTGNKKQLKLIDSAVYALVLDSALVGEDQLKGAHLMLHGPPENRWFDKSFQLILAKDGKAAINFEHSWGDGVAVLRFFNDMYKDSILKHYVHVYSAPSKIDGAQTVTRLDFQLDDFAKKSIEESMQNYKRLTGSLQLDALMYEKMNRDYIKNHKLSPDSVMQFAFQMAYHRLHGKTVATYESCSTSAFKHGRTETVRAATMATKKCAAAFNQSSRPSPAELKAMLAECTKVHNQLTKEAAMGQGFDRHLFGLRVMAERNGMPLPDLYKDQTYISGNHFILSTSTLYGECFSGGGFGAVVQDGLGVGYSTLANMLGCLVSSYPPNQDGHDFVDCLLSCFDDIHHVLEACRS